MFETEENVLSDDIQKEIEAQAASADITPRPDCTNDDKVQCATIYGPRAVESKILVSISENINTMAGAIKGSEAKRKNIQNALNASIGLSALWCFLWHWLPL